VITCPKCGKENQDHYKFCLGCGAELPRGGGAAKPFTSNTPPHGVPAARPAPGPAAAPAAPPAGAQAMATTAAVAPRPSQQPDPRATAPASPQGHGANVTCPQCGHNNTTGNRFCASCGYNLSALSGAQAVPSAGAAPAAQ